MKITIVIPLYNEEKHAVGVIMSLLPFKVSIVVVDDGSTDNSVNIIRKIKSPRLKILQHKINLGKGAAMKTGADYAFKSGTDAVVFMDSDGQHSAADLTKFINALETKKYGVVFGSRDYGLGVPLVRFLGNKLASVVINIAFGIYIADSICGYRGITKDAYKLIRWDATGYGVETEILARVAKNKIKFCEVKVETIYHDAVKGVTMLDAFGVLMEVVKWKLTI